MQINFGLESYQHESRPLSAQRMQNTYLEPAPPGAKTQAAVVPSFGIKPLTTLGSGPLRGGLFVNTVLYVVSGSSLFSLKDGVTTNLGSIPNIDRVFMASDGVNLVIVTAKDMYVWNGTTLTKTGGDYPGYMWMTYLDGYYIGGPGDRTFFINHTAFDPTTYNALDFASAESTPGNIVGSITDHREVFIFKNDACEVWYNSGDADFPLSRTASGFMEIGCTSRYGMTKADNSVFFSASDGTFRRVNGYTPVRISTTAIEQEVRTYAPQECICHSWIENGHTMIAFAFKENTFVYDASTSLWHERQSYGMANWRVAFLARGNNMTVVGDSTSNRVGILDGGVFTEWGSPLVSTVTSPAIAQDNQYIPHAQLELIYEQGVGLVTGQGSEPVLMLQFSDDGGRTWSNQISRSLGEIGDFRRAAIFNRLGQSRDRVYRCSVSDPVRRTLIQAILKNAA